MNRRDFLKTVGVGTVASVAAFSGCAPKGGSLDSSTLKEVPIGEMSYRTNPHTNDKVSLLGYGCMRWPLRPAADGSGEEVDQEAVNEMVDYAIAHGVNYFDTAPRYVRGLSEKATGIALSRHPRSNYFIATKMSNQAKEVRSREASIAMYHQSMKDLKTDYLDYYLLHSIGAGNGMDDFNERFIDNGILDFLLQERKAGRIRNLGWSYHGDIAVFDHLLSLDIQWDFAMIQLNYMDWQHAEAGRNTNAEYLYNELVKHHVPVVVMEPLLGGQLSAVNPYALSLLKQIHPEDSPASWAFRYAATPEHILTVLSGMTYIEHLQENIRTFSPLKPLNEQEYSVLDEVTEILLRSNSVKCTECQYCMPCPYGIDIPGIFLHYNRCIAAEQIPENSQDKAYREARRAFLIGYDRKIPKLRQADHCINCNICISKCPQRINIPKELERIEQYTELLKMSE